MSKKIWEVKNKSDKIGELLIMGDITSTEWFDEDVTPKKILNDLESLGDINELRVKISSNGGGVFAGVTIANIINQYGKDNNVEITGYVLGLAASIASIIACSLPKLIMYSSSMLMLHKPLTGMFWGNANDMRKMADDLDDIEEALINTYQNKTNLSKEEIKDMLKKETWLTAEESINLGFADEIEEIEVAASISNNKLIMNGIEFDISRYNNVPKQIIQNKMNKGVNNMAFKVFESEEDYNSTLNKYKVKLKEDEDFISEVTKGYMKIEDVINKFADVELEGENLEDLVNSVKKIKSDLEEVKNDYDEYKKKIKEDKLFATRKAKMTNVGIEVKDEDREEIINLSDKAVDMMINAAKKNNNKKINNDFDPNLTIDGDVKTEISDVIASL
ncbi:MAG: head maturation protease, ClpP-related [bacterium]